MSDKGVDITKILTSKDTTVFEDNINIVVGITAMQLGLVDLLRSIKMKPDNIVGYSIGEIGCAYADQALTVEQAILCSYYIGLASKNKKSDSELINNLRKVISTPKNRTSVWVTTTEKDISQTCSAEYLVHSMSASVSLNRTIPKDAIVVEIAPHGHLQDLLKRAFNDDIKTLSLARKDSTDGVQDFMRAVGKLYLLGCNPRLEFIYPDIQFPVSRGTPMISPLIKWDHSSDWYVTKFETQEKIKSGERTVTVLLSDEEMEYVAGHVIDGNVLI